ncbi:hypothetical protein CHH61_04105 [Shouchella clausii]|uniref:Uncharacterized protein n=1 Tax=Shouchella clausii TaxID=79880 RepID=A0A268S497_SHOCL|nr:hypothetical protein [Shouchella clausii]PAF27319.1 hypothetical protein CHH61_04105 [Shouchella clausii]
MNTKKKQYFKKAMSYVWFIAFIAWIFMGVGVGLFEYDPGIITRTSTFILASAYFYHLYDKSKTEQRQ